MLARDPSSTELLRVEGLGKHFPVHRGVLFRRQVATVKAVDDVSFTVSRGKTLGLVGESGCGKSTVGRLLVRLLEPTTGSIVLEGVDIAHLDADGMRRHRRSLQFIFQDPMSSLNPRLSIESIIAEPLITQGVAKADRRRRVEELLAMVGLPPPHRARYPHEFSGGQRQRIGIARSLATSPRFIVCDEPVSALDVSIQAQIVNLLKRLQRDLHLSYLFVAHDLSVVRHVSDRIAVMYLGRFVEVGPSDAIFRQPAHPYTQALLRAVPAGRPSPVRKTTAPLAGELPSPLDPPGGCAFHTRCPQAMPVCSIERPVLARIGEDHAAACHLLNR